MTCEMFDTCHTLNGGPKCTEVAEKIVSLFGWRQTYNVEKLQRNVPGRATTRISITRPSPNREKPPGEKVRWSWLLDGVRRLVSFRVLFWGLCTD